MDDPKNIEKWVLNDGRRAEKRVTEVNGENGQGERTIELHVEDERPLRLQQRVKEKTKPFVFERTIETVDPQTGEVIEQKLESIDPKVQMQVVEHITTASSVSAQNVENDCDCHVTKEEMVETIISAIKTLKEEQTVQMQSVPETPKRNRRIDNEFSNKLNSLGIVDELEKKMENSSILSGNKPLIYLIMIQFIGLLYIAFFM